jgi:hypothetical protein
VPPPAESPAEQAAQGAPRGKESEALKAERMESVEELGNCQRAGEGRDLETTGIRGWTLEE